MNKKGLSKALTLSIMVMSFVIIVGIVWFLTINTIKSSNGPALPNICMTISPSYLVDCIMNTTTLANGTTLTQHVQATATPSNINIALTKDHCTINQTYENYNIMNCSSQSNYTKYRIVISKY